jgi:hypothetical protein
MHVTTRAAIHRQIAKDLDGQIDHGRARQARGDAETAKHQQGSQKTGTRVA